VAAELVEKNAVIAQAKQVRLDFENRLPRDYTAPLDPGLFEEIAANLVGNALKFTPAGGAVRLTLTSRDGRLTLAVADTGPGIAPDDQKAVFEKFRRATGARLSEGMGYGLAIVAKFAKLHGGSVTLKSAPGKGSTFIVFFPER
jgi:signal transduction histidine kinase